MNSQKGFIQIPILIAIIVGVFVVGGAGYIRVEQYQKYQIEKLKKEMGRQNEQATTTTGLSEVEKLRQEVEELKKQTATQGEKFKDETSRFPSPAEVLKKTTDTTKNERDKVKKQPSLIPLPSTPIILPTDYRSQVFVVLNAAKDNYVKLKDFSQECATMTSQRKAAIQSLAANKATWLPSLAFDPPLQRQQEALYDVYDNEIAVMEGYRVYCGVTVPNALDQNIQAINNVISGIQSSELPLPSNHISLYHSRYFGTNQFESIRSNIQDVIDRARKQIVERNVLYREGLDAVMNYINNATAPTSQSTYYIPPTPYLPPLPQTTRCTIGTIGGGGVELVVNCSTSSF